MGIRWGAAALALSCWGCATFPGVRVHPAGAFAQTTIDAGRVTWGAEGSLELEGPAPKQNFGYAAGLFYRGTRYSRQGSSELESIGGGVVTRVYMLRFYGGPQRVWWTGEQVTAPLHFAAGMVGDTGIGRNVTVPGGESIGLMTYSLRGFARLQHPRLGSLSLEPGYDQVGSRGFPLIRAVLSLAIDVGGEPAQQSGEGWP